MREITASGQTVEEAVQSALEQLDTTRDQVDISIIDEGKKGILGLFGSKPAIVKAVVLKNQIEETKAFIQEVIKNMNVDVNIKTTVIDNHVTYELNGEKIAKLIGKRGQTLNALQYLVQLVLNKDGKQYYSVTLDAEGYRGRRKETLEALAKKMAEKAVRINKKVSLEPMPAFERKIIHSALQGRNDISTYSDGVEPHRHIVIKP
ncbi:RNA-binding cell elongation regulator Jag/EloR [Virgibacillus alimentarius]|uniref:RNA-binding protein KhpB n=1 Tax=Virgibacillus alimentarius TaxID=698769 RepID=A0ABS4S6G0_9BACI|nr:MULTISPECIES: RNA-binding cell elongation regulator Jag/EloR [Virgibacillus]MBP2257065.1 spoIIIJ-associated protein [Virgibacillus alimentarius]HLR68777.1 RNA-binding cell elongation regulator Jag/EloR [Virgibacillus sp.]